MNQTEQVKRELCKTRIRELMAQDRVLEAYEIIEDVFLDEIEAQDIIFCEWLDRLAVETAPEGVL